MDEKTCDICNNHIESNQPKYILSVCLDCWSADLATLKAENERLMEESEHFVWALCEIAERSKKSSSPIGIPELLKSRREIYGIATKALESDSSPD